MEVPSSNWPALLNRDYLYKAPVPVIFEYTRTKRNGDTPQNVIAGSKKVYIYRNINSKNKGLFYLTFDEDNTFQITRGKTQVSYSGDTIFFHEFSKCDGDNKLEITFPSKPTRFNEVLRKHFLEPSSTTEIVSQPNRQRRVHFSRQDLVNLPRTSEVLASDLCRSAETFASNLVRKAENVSQSLHDRADRIKKLREEYGSNQEVEVDEGLRNAAGVASSVTWGAAFLTTKAVNGIGCALSKFGNTFGPSIKAGTVSFITKQFDADERIVRGHVNTFCDLTGGVLASAGAVLSGVEQSVRVIGPGIVRTVAESLALEHGEQVGEVAGRLMETVGNVAEVSYNVKMVRPQLATKGIPDPKLDENCAYERFRRDFYR